LRRRPICIAIGERGEEKVPTKNIRLPRTEMMKYCTTEEEQILGRSQPQVETDPRTRNAQVKREGGEEKRPKTEKKTPVSMNSLRTSNTT